MVHEMKNWYQQNSNEVMQSFRTGKDGLTQEAAAKLLEEKGENALKEGKKKSTLQVFAEQFCDLMVIILLIAAGISMASGNVESTIVIAAVLILNAVLGTVQHVKAQKSLESLKSLSSPNAKVIRNGQKLEIPSTQVVPGDILVLEAGDLVAADGRILNNYSLQVNESSLTGESTNVEKRDNTLSGELPLADRTNMVYSGSLVTYGRAVVIVTETGMDTEIGKIAGLMNDTKEKKTPLQVSLDDFSKKLAVIIMIICGLVFLLSLYRQTPLMDSLMFAVALAVAAIPEALSSIVTIVQAMGTQKMARENAIIKDLKAVESLGCVSVICSDKTGTLTQNKMTVQQIYIDGKVYTPEQLDLHNQLHRYLLYDAILTNDSSIVNGKGIGDPTEYALLEMSRKISLDDDIMRELMHRMEEIPFDSERKMMSTKYELHSVPTVLTKGALDVMLERTTHIRFSDGIRPLTEADKAAINAQNKLFSEQGLRVLAFAYKEVNDDYVLAPENEKDYIFLGLISMIDPPREESIAAVADAKRAGIRTVMITGDHKITATAIARQIGIFEEGDLAVTGTESIAAVADAKRAGIRTVMITGDHKITATAIARQIGIFEEGDLAVTGTELDAMSDEELAANISKIAVYARVSPENKIRIVDAWQNKGNIVSMTGDGVNDAPALKKADIGVAMGITGTEVSKDAASMILSDDNFATIIKAVANGRNVYRNIRNAVQFLLSGNMAGILAVLYTSLMALPVPFSPVHLLFINLLTDSLPAIAIGMEPADKTLLSQKPRNPKEGILTKEFLRNLIFYGGLIAVCSMVSFHSGLRTGNAMTASTMAFATLTLARLFHGFNCRGEQSVFRLGITTNRYSLAAFAAGLVLLNLVLFVPILQTLFETVSLSLSQLGLVYLMAFLPTVIIQAAKVIRDSVRK